MKVYCYDAYGGQTSIGSGFFVSPEGHVVTNHHVAAVPGCSRLEIQTLDEARYPVQQVLYDDPVHDLTVLATGVHRDRKGYLTLARSLPEVGEQLVVVGGPLGLEQTVSEGIVSSLREIGDYGVVIQTTAPMSPGSSGSPVVAGGGQVVGVATFVLLAGQNLNFAVPVGHLDSFYRPGAARAHARQSERRAASAGPASLGEAIALYDRGDYRGATRALRACLREDRRSVEAYYYLGLCCMAQEQSRAAVSAFTTATRIDPGHARAWFGLGLALEGLRRYRRASEAFAGALRAGDDREELHYHLGLAYALSRRSAEAEQEYEILRRLGSEYAERLRETMNRGR